ncbi:MAG TPA: methionine adenosyltransferase [Candidatus Stercoripulliclostridium merdipullorum]|uniref:S-adenosylmethionine synthase n=1 Tax=Candidatus Stercoripulliclostridium merdipullorum TaxID=2840952 RepID=A0A9D1NBD5_9FIRM|nr:methionine adenosyltransferase [Candidatus Stercoripulliclostridium merdipullorum]
MKRLFTSESVTEGHPDKLCDKIADSILDALLGVDPDARVACEVAATTGMVLVMGEISIADGYVDIASVARNAIKEIGYDDPETGFDYRSCAVLVAIDEQSPDIAMGVNDSVEHREGGDSYDRTGAGDQGMMFGYASDETECLMPMAIVLAHALTARLAEVRKQKILPYLRPDGKAQVTVEYDGNAVKRVEAIVVSTQHAPDVDIETLRADIRREVIGHAVPAELIDEDTKIYINPTGRFVVGGPQGDSGVTGRKIIVDTYGGYAAHGGGAFSGKDPTKVDRSAAYFARYVAKNIVAAGLASKCELQVAYAIGKANPVSISVNTFGTGKIADEAIAQALPRFFDFRPRAIIDRLALKTPIYARTTNYGHFGRDGFSWERTDRAEELRQLL